MAVQQEILTDSVLNLFGRDFVKTLALILIKNKKRATGTLIKSLDYRIQPTARAIVLAIEAEDYLEVIDSGRRAGKFPPIKDIARWARIKGISQDAVFPIARSIFKFGIKPTNVLDQTANEILNSPALAKKYEQEIGANLEELITKLFGK